MSWKGFDFIPHGTSVPFMDLRQICLTISTMLIVVSGIMFFSQGLNYGIDFKGGLVVEIGSKDKSDIDIGKLRSRMESLKLGDVQVQEFGQKDVALIRFESQPGGEQAQSAAFAKVRKELGEGVDYRREESVGPIVSAELKQDGTIAVIVSIICVLLYIWMRFEWQFSIGAVAALVHDVALTIGVFSFLGLEFGLSIIAALLTIVGYSLNDTVVVYDRVRENLRKYKKKTLPDLLNLSINETLSRTILTSVTTLIALVSLYILGGEVLRPFVFAMIWGVIVGTYSSVFIASPVLLMFGVKRDWSGVEKAKTAEASV